jgi:flagellar hook protein FlgE
MAFQQGLSGLNGASKNLDVISNNVANAATVGFKSSRAVFADVYASSLTGSSDVGIGSTVADVAQEFGQGNVTSTNNPLDVAINGGGFFRMSQEGAVTFSRNGQFHLDPAGYLVNTDNQRVTGYGVDASGTVIASTPLDVRINTADIAPVSTGLFRFGANLDARAVTPTAAAFNMADPASYNNTTSGSVYDSLGNAHTLTYFFAKTPTTGQWNVYGSVDGTAVTNVDLGAGAGNPLVLNFDANGVLTTAMPVTAALTIASGAVSPISLSLDMNGTTQFGSDFSVNSMFQDGYASGRLVGLSIGSDGTIKGRYTNGESQNLARIVLANFANPNGLKPLGQNQWSDTPDSGLPVIGSPGSGSLGALQSSAVEDSNVDLTAELVAMITAQRIYQANAQSIKTQDEVMQTLVNLR